IASLLIGTFFFVSGINLLFNRKVFSIWKNLKYVTIGLLVLSVSLSFIFASFELRFGGGVGNMISDWLTGALGNFGTPALLLVIGLGYIIWQFNPAFNLPAKTETPVLTDDEAEDEADTEEEGEEEVEDVAVNDIKKKGKEKAG